MFERKIYNDIVSWHESLKIKKRALIIKGLKTINQVPALIRPAVIERLEQLEINIGEVE